MATKTSLAAALNQAAGKPADVDPVTAVKPPRTAAVIPSRAGKRVISGFFDPAVARQMRQIALDRETTVQGLLGEAINDLFAKHGKPRIA